MRLFLCIFFLLVGFSSRAVDMAQIESQLLNDLQKVWKEKTFEEQFKSNLTFKENLKKALGYEGTFKYPFDSLKKVMSVLTAPDNSFRLFNWNIEKPNGEFYYSALVMKFDKRRDRYVFTELFDKSASLLSPETRSLDQRRWYGALYYKIIVLPRGGKDYYTLLGWDGNDRVTTKKIIDVMAFSGSKIKFGFPIFRMDGKWKRRVIFEYADDASVSVRHYKTKKTEDIVFDHLSPASPQLEGQAAFLYPDLSYDAFRLTKGKWLLLKDVDARRNKSIMDKHYNTPN